MASEALLPLACYGKLPFWPEYIERGPRYPTSDALRDFLHRGRAAAGLDAQPGAEIPRESRSRRFAIVLPRSVEVAIGVVRPSTDQGGLRAFPFAVYTHAPRRLLANSPSLMPLALESVWQALDDAWNGLVACVEESSFEETLRSHRVRPPEWNSALSREYESLLRDDASILADGRGDVSIGSLALGMKAAVRQIRQREGERGLAVAVPARHDEAGRAFDAAFWMDLVAKQFWWRRAEPSFFIDEGSAAGGPDIVLVFGALENEFYASVMRGEDGADVIRPCRPLNEGAALEAHSRTFEDILRLRFSS